MKKISDDMLSVNKDKPLYLYATSHGFLPLSVLLKSTKNSKRKEIIQENLDLFPEFDQFTMTLNATPDPKLDTASLLKILNALDTYKYSQQELLFTPQNLKNIIKEWPEDIQKFIVIQGCFSGGFVDSDIPKFREQSLRDTPNTTILTASRYDRSSFGCDFKSEKTYYGGAYIESLKKKQTPIEKIDWKILHEEVNAKITQMEKKRNFKPSLPQFVKN